MDWKKYRLTIGAVVLVGLVGATVWAAQGRTGETGDLVDEGAAGALPEVDKNEIDELEIKRPDDDGPIKLVKKGGSWRVVAPVEASPDQNAIDTALDKLAELEVTGVAATRKDNHEKLEVSADKGIHVKARRDGQNVAHLIVGAYRGGSTMIRTAEDEQVLSVKGSIKYAFNKELKNWRDRQITDVSANDVKEVSFESENGSFEFVRGDGDQWVLADGQEEIERFKGTKVQSLVSSISRMKASDFADPGVTLEQAGLAEPKAKVTMRVVDEPEEAQDGGEDAEEGAPEGAEGEAGAGEAEEGGDEAAPEAETVVLFLGGEVEGKDQFYARREGSDVIHTVSKYLSERLAPDLDKFQEAEDGGEDAANEGAPGGVPGGVAGGVPGAPPGGGKIPPEMMKQIQEQLRRQGVQPN